MLRSTLVETTNPEMVLVRNVDFYALCERYLMPFFGQAHVGYIPDRYSAHASTHSHPFDRLLLTTGAVPVQLPLHGADLPHVYYLRTLAECRALLARHPALFHKSVELGK